MAKAKVSQATEESDVQVKVYELASHIVSSIPEEEVGKVYESLKDLITTSGGAIIAEEAPKLMDLAYVMVKHIHGKNVRHSTANFSWIKFEIDPAAVPAINEAVSKNDNILRYMTIKTVKESTLYGHKFAHEAKEGNGKREYRKDKVEAAEPKPVEAAEVDQVIEDIVNK